MASKSLKGDMLATYF